MNNKGMYNKIHTEWVHRIKNTHPMGTYYKKYTLNGHILDILGTVKNMHKISIV